MNPPPPEISTLSLLAALPIFEQVPSRLRPLLELRGDHPELQRQRDEPLLRPVVQVALEPPPLGQRGVDQRSEEHTSELQSRQYLVCRLLLEKKKKITNTMDRQ